MFLSLLLSLFQKVTHVTISLMSYIQKNKDNCKIHIRKPIISTVNGQDSYKKDNNFNCQSKAKVKSGNNS